jgi:hypothetical protein
MARICPACRESLAPVNECICDLGDGQPDPFAIPLTAPPDSP